MIAISKSPRIVGNLAGGAVCFPCTFRDSYDLCRVVWDIFYGGDVRKKINV